MGNSGKGHEIKYQISNIELKHKTWLVYAFYVKKRYRFSLCINCPTNVCEIPAQNIIPLITICFPSMAIYHTIHYCHLNRGNGMN